MKNIGIGQGGYYLFGKVYASIGELDVSFSFFDKDIEGRESFMLNVKRFLANVPRFWEHPRVKLVMEKIGLPNK